MTQYEAACYLSERLDYDWLFARWIQHCVSVTCPPEQPWSVRFCNPFRCIRYEMSLAVPEIVHGPGDFEFAGFRWVYPWNAQEGTKKGFSEVRKKVLHMFPWLNGEMRRIQEARHFGSVDEVEPDGFG